jgi:glycosyltransferase involved in cell wall biosynthesis
VTGSRDHDERRLALVMWGDLFEDFFDTIGVSLEGFRTELTGGWLFAYVRALALHGVTTSLIGVSARVSAPHRFVHEPTGTSVTLLPAPRRHRWLRALYRRSRTRKSLSSLASYGSIPVRDLIRELRRCGAEAILTQEYEHARFDVLVGIGALLKLPVFATFQGGDAPHSYVERLIRPLTIRSCAGLIVGSGRERDRVSGSYRLPAQQIGAIPNAMELPEPDASARVIAREALNIPMDTIVVGWQGRVTIRRKGLDILLEAWEEVSRRHPDRELLLLLVGTGQDAAEFRRQIQERELDGIRWRDDYISDRGELLPYQAAADIFVLPSRHEGFPVAPIEAMALGLPVVAADAPGVSDIFADGEASGGIVVPREDPGALASALARLIVDAELRQGLGARARQRVEANYAVEAVGAELRRFMFGDETANG